MVCMFDLSWSAKDHGKNSQHHRQCACILNCLWRIQCVKAILNKHQFVNILFNIGHFKIEELKCSQLFLLGFFQTIHPHQCRANRSLYSVSHYYLEMVVHTTSCQSCSILSKKLTGFNESKPSNSCNSNGINCSLADKEDQSPRDGPIKLRRNNNNTQIWACGPHFKSHSLYHSKYLQQTYLKLNNLTADFG